jgi:hypothetical protein
VKRSQIVHSATEPNLAVDRHARAFDVRKLPRLGEQVHHTLDDIFQGVGSIFDKGRDPKKTTQLLPS